MTCYWVPTVEPLMKGAHNGGHNIMVVMQYPSCHWLCVYVCADDLCSLQHHCRSCGGVFCNNCSENSLQLASSSKPVRVCDSCYSMLLERASSN